jgi:hypothetical protein
MLPSPELLLTLSPSVLRDLLAVFAPDKPAGTPHATVRDLFTRSGARAGRKLSALFSSTLPRFSTRGGRAALAEAARASSDPHVEELLSFPHADVAPFLLLALERETKPAKRRALRRLFALAAHRVSRDLPERPTYELVPESPDAPTASLFASSAPSSAPQVKKLLTRALGDSLLDAWVTTTPDGATHVALFLKQPTENRLVHDESSRTKITLRRDVPVAVDLVRIFPCDSGMRVAFTMALPELLPTYAAALSLSLGPSATLRPLQTLAPDALARIARATTGVAAIEVVGVRYRRPNGKRIEVRGPDALDPSDYGPRTGYIDRATIRVTMDAGESTDAFVQLPHRVEILDGALAKPVRAVLTSLGLFAPGALPDDARSLAPYEHGDWRWCAVVGKGAFTRMCASGLLVRTRSSHVSSEEHRMHGAAYVVRDVPGEPDVQYALAEDRSLGARLVEAKDRVAWRLDTRALASTMARELGAVAAPAPLAIAGLLDLGIVSLASGKLRVVYAMAEPQAGWLEAVRRACGVGVTPVVLVPKGHEGGAPGMLEIELDVGEQLGAQRVARVLGRIAQALGIPDEVPAPLVCEEDVLFDAASERVWVTGVPIAFNEQRRKFVELLARQGGAVAATKDIGAAISKSGYPDVVARRMKSQVDRQVRRELEAAGVDASIVDRMIVAEGRQGYRFGVSVRFL